MKTLFTITIASLLSLTVFAQDFKVSPYAEFSGKSFKNGLTAGIVLPLQYATVEIGGFYQKAAFSNSTENDQFSNIEKEFYGMNTSFFIIDWVEFNLAVNVRAGRVNNEYFSISPMVKSEFLLGGETYLQLGAGLRGFTPTVLAGLAISF